MKFINRTEELNYLKEAKDLAHSKLFTVSISGLRRIGKTRLILEFLKEKNLYFFVNKYKSTESLLAEYELVLKEKGVLKELERIETWDDFFKVLFKRFHGVVAFDEFQNFSFLDKAVYGILQKYIDLNENRKELLLIFSGSLVGLMNKLFSSGKEPLYGRIKRKFLLRELSFKSVFEMCGELGIRNIEEVIQLYAIFGGFPKYYISLEDENLKGNDFMKIMDKFFFTEMATLEEEVKEILALEFGKRSGVYYDILSAIACGNTKISEIASFLRKKESAIARQMNELRHYFELIGVEESLINHKKIFYIKHPLMNFWFRYFYKNISGYKRREQKVIESIKADTNAYVGRKFEQVCKKLAPSLLPRKYVKWGKWWGFYRENNERKTAEIDLLALNESKNEILFGECKWKENVTAEKIIRDLASKTKFVLWHNTERKEIYAVFAKSFKSKINEFEGKKVYCFDLSDLERVIKK